MLNLSHKKLDVWKDSIKLIAKIYEITEDFPSEEKFGLVSQMRRASVSITSNLSEGAGKIIPKRKKKILRNCQIFASRSRYSARNFICCKYSF